MAFLKGGKTRGSFSSLPPMRKNEIISSKQSMSPNLVHWGRQRSKNYPKDNHVPTTKTHRLKTKNKTKQKKPFLANYQPQPNGKECLLIPAGSEVRWVMAMKKCTGCTAGPNSPPAGERRHRAAARGTLPGPSPPR